MKKEDLKLGNIIETKNGKRYIYLECQKNDLIDLDGVNQVSLHYYNDDLTRKNDSKIDRDLDVQKIYEDYTLKKVLWERKEKTKLTETEKVILSNLPKECKYIARDREGNLYVHLLSPRKEWGQWLSKGSIESLVVYNHLFNFIKWEDEFPTLIEDLLKE